MASIAAFVGGLPPYQALALAPMPVPAQTLPPVLAASVPEAHCGPPARRPTAETAVVLAGILAAAAVGDALVESFVVDPNGSPFMTEFVVRVCGCYDPNICHLADT